MADRRAKQIKIWDSRHMFFVCIRYFPCQVFLSSILDRFSVYFPKISHVKVFKRLLLPKFSSNFNQTLWKAWQLEENGVDYFWGWSGTLKKLWQFEIFVDTGPYGNANFKTLFLLRFSAKLYEDIGYHGGIQAIAFPGNRSKFIKMWHFDILTWVPMGKS